MGMCGGGSDAGEEARQLENERQARIQTGLGSINQTFAKFDPAFYKQRQTDFTNYAMPQLYRQLAQTNRVGAYGLANRGLSTSGAANQFGSNLGYEANVQKQAIGDQAIAQSQQLQKDVEGQRSQLIAQLQASADPTSAAQQALSAAGTYSLPSAWAPIGNMFGNFAQIYAANQTAQAYNPQRYQSRYGMTNSPLGNSAYSIGT